MLANSGSRHLARLLFGLYLAWGILYIYRTSFDVDGVRVFSLWDDAMISMRYARNLVIGNGLAWNSGEAPIQGFSNPGATAIMAAIHMLPLSREKTSLVFQLLNLALLFSVVRLMYVASTALFNDRLLATVTCIGGLFCAPLAVQGLQGTDVALMAFILLAALCAAFRDLDANGRLSWKTYSILAFGLIMRLDFVIICFVFLFRSLWFETRKSLLAGLAIVSGTLAAVLSLQYFYYGDALPNTFYLKMTGSPLLSVLSASLLQKLVVFGGLWWAALLSLFTFVKWRRHDPRLWLLVGCVAASWVYDLYVGGDWLSPSRFLVPTFPLMIIAGCGAFYIFLEQVFVEGRSSLDSPRLLSPFVQAVSFVVVALVFLLQLDTSGMAREWFLPGEETLFHEVNKQNYIFAKYISRRISPDAAIAVHWGGSPAYFIDNRVVDVLGKSDSHIAHLSFPGRPFRPGHTKWDWDYIVNDRKPDIIDLATRCLDARDDFRRDYSEVRSSGVHFFLRKESLSKLNDPEGVVGPVVGENSGAC